MHLKQEIERHPRMHGTYLIDLVSVESFIQQGLTENDVLDLLYCQWSGLSSVDDLLERGNWDPYRVEPEHQWEMLVHALKGGGAVGHTIDTIPALQAESFARRFLALFDCPTAYWGLGIGSPDWAFEHGLLVLDQKRAGLLLVLEND